MTSKRTDTERLRVTVELELCFDPGRKKNKMHMTLADTSVSVSVDDNEVGEICACLGGGVEVQDRLSGKTWFLSSLSLWTGFRAAIDKAMDTEEGDD